MKKGIKISVFCNEDLWWYPGTVTSIRRDKSLCVKYDDGTIEEELAFDKEKIIV